MIALQRPLGSICVAPDDVRQETRATLLVLLVASIFLVHLLGYHGWHPRPRVGAFQGAISSTDAFLPPRDLDCRRDQAWVPAQRQPVRGDGSIATTPGESGHREAVLRRTREAGRRPRFEVGFAWSRLI